MTNELQASLDEAATWIEELAQNLRSGNTLTPQHSQDLTNLTTALSELSTTDQPLGPLKKRKRKKNKSESVSMNDLEPISMEEFLAEGGKLPEWAIPRGAK